MLKLHATFSQVEQSGALDPGSLTAIVTGYALPALQVLLIILAAWVVAAWVRRVTTRLLERKAVERTISSFLANVARWGVLALGLVAVLGIFGIETATFAVVIGAFGLAIGLALQGTLGNAAAGFMLLIFRPFKAGDFINAAGVLGKVAEVELFATNIDTPDNRRIVVPNGAVFGSTIENISHHPTRRVDVAVGVAYDADIARTREVLLEAANSVEERLADPAPAVALGELADSSVNWAVRVWVNAADFWPVKDELTERVKNALDRAEIAIPFPQLDVHLQGDAGRLAPAETGVDADKTRVPAT